MKVYSNSDFRDEFLLGAAKAFWACAYADYIEDPEADDDDPRKDLPRPGGGEDWMDYLPPIPPNAFAIAGELWSDLTHANKHVGCGVYSLADLARQADGDGIDVEEFGHYLAMQYMGHGVSWFDDHEKFEIEIPYREVSFLEFDSDAYHVDHEE